MELSDRLQNSFRRFSTSLFQATQREVVEISNILFNPPNSELREVARNIPIIPRPTPTQQNQNNDVSPEQNNDVRQTQNNSNSTEYLFGNPLDNLYLNREILEGVVTQFASSLETRESIETINNITSA